MCKNDADAAAAEEADRLEGLHLMLACQPETCPVCLYEDTEEDYARD